MGERKEGKEGRVVERKEGKTEGKSQVNYKLGDKQQAKVSCSKLRQINIFGGGG